MSINPKDIEDEDVRVALMAAAYLGIHDPPSRRVTAACLRHWAHKDPLALAALRAGCTEAELIHQLFEDRSRLMEQLHDCLSKTASPTQFNA